MRRSKSNILILLFVLLSSSCTAKTAKEDTIKTKLLPKDFSYLKIQTVLPPEDQAYYKRVHNEISEIGKHFAYRESNALEKYCPVLGKMFDEISVRPISREREREIYLLSDFCNQDGSFSRSYKPLTYEEYKYINKKITNSASILDALANYEGNLMYKSSSSVKESHKKTFENYWKRSLLVDLLDLSPYRNQSSLEKEYCKKAVELKQWDHIYYLTENVDIISCLKDGEKYPTAKDIKCCREAMKLVVKGWSKENLYSGDIINPSADEMLPGAYEETVKLIRDAIFKATGRDLDKEPPIRDSDGKIILK